MRGRFITLEGGEGVGKSTQTRLLVEALRARNIEVLQTREPGGTPGAEKIRELLLSHDNDWSIAAESLLFAAARADHLENAIRPALAQGHWVVCDRFVDSSRAYQGGAAGISDDDILELHRIGSQGLLPDLTILLQADEAEIQQRLLARDGNDSDRIGGRSSAYHCDVAERFAGFARAEPARFRQVSAVGSPEAVHGQILQAILPLLEDAA